MSSRYQESSTTWTSILSQLDLGELPKTGFATKTAITVNTTTREMHAKSSHFRIQSYDNTASESSILQNNFNPHLNFSRITRRWHPLRTSLLVRVDLALIEIIEGETKIEKYYIRLLHCFRFFCWWSRVNLTSDRSIPSHEIWRYVPTQTLSQLQHQSLQNSFRLEMSTRSHPFRYGWIDWRKKIEIC